MSVHNRLIVFNQDSSNECPQQTDSVSSRCNQCVSVFNQDVSNKSPQQTECFHLDTASLCAFQQPCVSYSSIAAD